MRHYALIPAKEHSSRCPDKNWRHFVDDMNLVSYLISIIPDNVFDKVILSTDKTNERTNDRYTVHHRNPSMATTESPINDTIGVIIDLYKLQDDDYIWLLNPTSPFRKIKDFLKIRNIIEDKGINSIVSVTNLSPFIWRDNITLFKTSYPRVNTQDVKEQYNMENGQYIVFKVGLFKGTNSWYSGNTYLFEQNGLESFIDIDTEDDFKFAQELASVQIHNKNLKKETFQVEYVIKEPIKEHTQHIYNHFSRYSNAIQSLDINNTDTVIDASCGVGYGSFILSLKSRSVIGIDINQSYLDRAKRLFHADNLDFLSYDIMDLYKHKSNKIVCIETFEHVPKTQMVIFVNRLLSYLKVGGNMYIDVPIGNNDRSCYNEFHLNEPSIDVLYNTFKNHFDKITFKIDSFVNSFGYETKSCSLILRNKS